MKKLITSLALLASLPALNAQTTIAIVNTSNSGSITCSNPSVTLVAFLMGYTATPAAPSFSWSSGGLVTTGSVATITTPGSYTVSTVFNGNTLHSIYTVGSNTVAPISTLVPLSQSITCNNAAVSVSAAATPTTNIIHYWLSPSAYLPPNNLTMTSYSFLSVFPVGAPGVYTNVAVNNSNGCSTIKTFTVASSSSYPLQNVSSIDNFTLGCGTHSTANIQLDGNTSPIAGGAINYTLLAPGFSGTYTPTNTTGVYNITTPGTYTAVIKDIVSGCESKFPFSVMQDIASTGTLVVPAQVLSCYLPSLTLTALSPQNNVNYHWNWPGGGSSSASAIVVTVTGTGTSPGSYSLTITNLNNGCTSGPMSASILQNIAPPHAVIARSGTAISCNTPSIMLTNASSTGITPSSGFPTNAPIVAELWVGPTPQPSAALTYSYMAATPGIYSLTVQDYNNGCRSTTVAAIGDNRTYPVLTATNAFMLCNPTETIYPAVSGPATALSYTWTGTGIVSGINSASATVNAAGIYTLSVTNTQSGCMTTAAIEVLNCTGTGIAVNSANNQALRIYPNPSADGVFSVSNITGDITVEIYNSLGALVLKQNISSKETTLDLKNAASGVYFINVSSNNAVYTSNLIKQ